MHGTNDAAVITGSSTAELTETNAAQIDRRRSSAPPTWTARAPSWRRPTRPAATATASSRSMPPAPGPTRWTTPTTSSWAAGLHRQHHGGDGRRHREGHHRHHARHQRRGGDHRLEHGGADRDQCGAVTGGDLNATDVDSSSAFVAQTDVAGSNGYGKFSIDAAGTWTYTMNDAHDEFVGGQSTTPTASRWRRPTAPRRS